MAVFCSTAKMPHDFDSEAAYTRYLPKRLKELTFYAKQRGINAAIDWIAVDDDLNSFLFILDAQVSYTLLAYSRQKQFFNKTAVSLQKELFPKDDNNGYQVASVFARLVSTAQKGDTYAPYRWRLSATTAVRSQMAYVHWLTQNEKNYVLGAALFIDYRPDAFILKHRVRTVAKRIKKEGLEALMPLLAHDLDPLMYFYVRQQRYPYRSIINGGDDKFDLKTPEEVQRAVYPDCKDDTVCNLDVRYRRFEAIAKHGGGFYAYLWPTKNKDLQLKIDYIEPIKYKKNHYILASGIDLINTQTNIHRILVDQVERTLKLIKEIGLENTISVVHKENEHGASIFIDEINPPYTQIANVDRTTENITAEQVKIKMISQCKDRVCPDAYDALVGLANFAKSGGGFFAYIWRSGEAEKYRTVLKVSYVKPFTYGGKEYDVGSGFWTK